MVAGSPERAHPPIVSPLSPFGGWPQIWRSFSSELTSIIKRAPSYGRSYSTGGSSLKRRFAIAQRSGGCMTRLSPCGCNAIGVGASRAACIGGTSVTRGLTPVETQAAAIAAQAQRLMVRAIVNGGCPSLRAAQQQWRCPTGPDLAPEQIPVEEFPSES